MPRYSLWKCAWPGLKLPLELVNVKCKYAKWKPIHDLLLDSHGNFYPIYNYICHYFQDTHCQKVHQLDIYIGPMSEPTHALLVDGNTNFYSMSQFPRFSCQNVHDLDHNL